MDLLHPRCAGVDVSKRDAKVCVRLAREGRAGATSTVTTWSSMTGQILALREHLITEGVTLVVMEATGDYWKPFYYLLEEAPFEVLLVNARQVKNVPGRKTDVSDATWLAQLGAHGLVRGSFVPLAPVRQLRDLTRTRTSIVRERTREWQRLEKLLEDAGVKLTSVATDISGPSGRAMLDAMIDGERNPAVLADQARARLRDKIPALTEALEGRFTEHHAFLTRLHLRLIDEHTAAFNELPSDRGGDRALSSGPRAARDRPGDQHHPGRHHHRRDRRGHDPLPHRRPLGVLGRHHPGQPRIRRAGGSSRRRACRRGTGLRCWCVGGTRLPGRRCRLRRRRGCW